MTQKNLKFWAKHFFSSLGTAIFVSRAYLHFTWGYHYVLEKNFVSEVQDGFLELSPSKHLKGQLGSPVSKDKSSLPVSWDPPSVTKNHHFCVWEMTDDKAGQVRSELSAKGTKRDVENTPKCARPNCNLARWSNLGPPPIGRHRT